MAWKDGFVIEYVEVPKDEGKHAKKKKKNPKTRSSLSVKGLAIGRRVRDRQGRIGNVSKLSRTEAVVSFNDGTKRKFKVPDDFSDGNVSVLGGR